MTALPNISVKYIIIALVLFSCNNSARQSQPTEQRSVSEVLDTVKAGRASLPISPVIFEAAFIKGTTSTFQDAAADLYGVNIGKINVTSGRIIACDPTLMEEYGIAFTQQFPAGEFPVQLSIVRSEGEESIAFSRIMFSDEPVARWEYALQNGQQPLPLKGKERYSYVVDAGVGTFVDSAAAKALDISKITSLEADVYRGMLRHLHNKWRYNLYEFGTNNMAVFSSGFGDGNYSTFIGFDAAGKPCRLLTDFEIFDWK